eukprot:6416304-Pyramimonas_sp.AAC.1
MPEGLSRCRAPRTPPMESPNTAPCWSETKTLEGPEERTQHLEKTQRQPSESFVTRWSQNAQCVAS